MIMLYGMQIIEFICRENQGRETEEFSEGSCSTIELRAGQIVLRHGTEKSEIYEKAV